MSVNRHPNTQGVTIKQWRYTATGGETTLSGTDGFSQSLTYTPGAEEVFVNGVLLVRGTDYTASTGTTVVLNNALVAGDIATVSAPSVFNVANSIPSSTVTAKGDLLVANGSASLTNLAVGADGSTLVANSSAGGGVSWAGPSVAAGKNLVINGGFDIWQRSTSTTTTAASYVSADRWATWISAGSGTIAQDTSIVPPYCRYGMRFTSSASSSSIVYYHTIETQETLRVAGQNVTVSFYAAGTSGAQLSYNMWYSTSTDASFTAVATQIGSTTTTVTLSGTSTITKTTFSVPSNAQTIQLRIFNSSAYSSGQFFTFGAVQLELGSAATTFSRAGGTLQGELAACQRYYQRISAVGNPTVIARSLATGTTAMEFIIPLPVPLRSYGPPILDASTLRVSVYGQNDYSSGTFVTNYSGTLGAPSVVYTHGSAVFSQNQAGTLNTTTGYLGLSAEL